MSPQNGHFYVQWVLLQSTLVLKKRSTFSIDCWSALLEWYCHLVWKHYYYFQKTTVHCSQISDHEMFYTLQSPRQNDNPVAHLARFQYRLDSWKNKFQKCWTASLISTHVFWKPNSHFRKYLQNKDVQMRTAPKNAYFQRNCHCTAWYQLQICP